MSDGKSESFDLDLDPAQKVLTDYEKDLRCQAAIEEIGRNVLTYRTWPDVEYLLKQAFAAGWNSCIESIEEELASE